MSWIMGSSLFGFPVKLGISIPAPGAVCRIFHTAASWGRPEKGWRLSQGFLLKLCRVMFDQIFVVFMISWQIFKIQIASLRVDLHKIWSFVFQLFQLFQLDISPIVAISLLGASFLDKSRRGFYCCADADFLASINAAARRCRLRAWRWMDGWDLAWLCHDFPTCKHAKICGKLPLIHHLQIVFHTGRIKGFSRSFWFFCMFTRRYERENVKQ